MFRDTRRSPESHALLSFTDEFLVLFPSAFNDNQMTRDNERTSTGLHNDRSALRRY